MRLNEAVKGIWDSPKSSPTPEQPGASSAVVHSMQRYCFQMIICTIFGWKATVDGRFIPLPDQQSDFLGGRWEFYGCALNALNDTGVFARCNWLEKFIHITHSGMGSMSRTLFMSQPMPALNFRGQYRMRCAGARSGARGMFHVED